MKTLSNMGLVAWDQTEDSYNHTQLAGDMAKVDNHDHTPGRGVRLTAESIQPGTITPELFASSVVTYPTGGVMGWAADTAPEGFLLCDGSPILRETYSALFAVIKTKYGAGDGTTTFNLPNLQGTVIVGAGTGSGLTTRALAQKGGEEAHKLAATESGVPAHAHDMESINAGGAPVATLTSGGKIYIRGDTVGGGAGDGLQNRTDGSFSFGIGVAAAAAKEAGSSHNNMQPFVVLNYIIKV